MHTLQTGGNCECAVNPTLMREEYVRLTSAIAQKKVIVVGGGLAGMEAARVLKLRGHDVDLYEKSDRLAGNLNGAGSHKFKNDVKRLSQWYQRKLKELEIPVMLNTDLSAQDIINKKPDSVILATGSLPVSIRFDGSDRSSVISCLDAIEHEEKLGKNVVVVGGGQIGCEIAMDLAETGRKVTIVEAMEDILSSGAMVPGVNKMALVDILENKEVCILKSAHLDSVDETGANITLTKENRNVHIDADSVVMSIGFRPKASIAGELVGNDIEYYEVGDGARVGDVRSTIHSAFEIARRV